MTSGYHQQKFMHASMRFHSAINQPNYTTVLTTPCGSCTNDATPLLVSKYVWYHGLNIFVVPWSQNMFGTMVSNDFWYRGLKLFWYHGLKLFVVPWSQIILVPWSQIRKQGVPKTLVPTLSQNRKLIKTLRKDQPPLQIKTKTGTDWFGKRYPRKCRFETPGSGMRGGSIWVWVAGAGLGPRSGEGHGWAVVGDGYYQGAKPWK